MTIDEAAAIATLTAIPVVSDPTMPTWSSGWRPMRHDEAARVVAALSGSAPPPPAPT